MNCIVWTILIIAGLVIFSACNNPQPEAHKLLAQAELLTVFILLQGCIASSNNISPDETAKKNFTRTELEGIGQMIRFVDDLNSAGKYMKYLQEIGESDDKNSMAYKLYQLLWSDKAKKIIEGSGYVPR